MKSFRISDDLALPLAAVTQRMVILGQSESGKSNLAILLAELMLREGAPITVLDAAGVWHGLRSEFSIYIFGGEHGDRPLPYTSGKLMADVITDSGISCVLDISEFTPQEQRTFVADFAQELFLKQKRSKRPRHLFIEEAHGVVPQEKFEKQDNIMLGRMLRALRVLRNYGLGWTLISQEPQGLHKRATDQASTFFVGRIMGTASKKAVMGIISDKVSTEEDLKKLAEMPKLKTGTFLVYSPVWLEWSGKAISVYYRTTFDAGKPRQFRGKRLAGPKTLAAVDLEKLDAATNSATAQADSADPTKLRRRIAELETALKAKPQIKVPRDVALEHVTRKTIKIPIVVKGEVVRMEKLVKRLEAAAEERRKRAGHEFKLLAMVANDIDQRLNDGKNRMVTNGELQRMATALPSYPEFKEIDLTKLPPHQPFTREAKILRDSVSGKIIKPGKGEIAVLTAVAQHTAGVTRQKVTALTGYRASTRNAYIQRLGQSGHITQMGEHFFATDAGRALLGPDFKPLPTGPALVEHLLATLPKGESVILDHVLKKWPAAVFREDLPFKTSTRNAYVQRLKARELLTDAGPKHISASPHLMEA